ncbi:MAG: flagellin lysine-N-methylase [Clostridia bacterium]|nr:flagellin lysine-N-methylase [Clostridia bacterium]
MKLYAPTYYKNFKCIADQCEHSCCIGWEIDIDEDSVKTYKTLKSGYGAVVADSISMEDTPHFKLAEHDRCPHLDGRGLCKIILNLGEDYLCDICREHPRFYNFTSVAEVGLGLSCPEAARLILGSADFAEMEEVGAVDAEADEVEFDGRAKRSELYAILQDTAHGYASALDQIYRLYSIDAGEDREWLERLDSLEYLNVDHKSLFLQYSSNCRPTGAQKDDYLKRFLAYLIYRHCTEAFDAEDFGVRLAFCLFCERLFASLICSQGAQSLQEIAALASILSEEIEYSDENTETLMYLFE